MSISGMYAGMYGELKNQERKPPKLFRRNDKTASPFASWMKQSKSKKLFRQSALTGELGILQRPGGGVSTEISITVTDPRISKGRPTNIPLLVQGQTGVESLLAGEKWTQEQEEIAILRAISRVSEGSHLPSYKTIDEAVTAAKKRSKKKSDAMQRAELKRKR